MRQILIRHFKKSAEPSPINLSFVIEQVISMLQTGFWKIHTIPNIFSRTAEGHMHDSRLDNLFCVVWFECFIIFILGGRVKRATIVQRQQKHAEGLHLLVSLLRPARAERLVPRNDPQLSDLVKSDKTSNGADERAVARDEKPASATRGRREAAHRSDRRSLLLHRHPVDAVAESRRPSAPSDARVAATVGVQGSQ